VLITNKYPWFSKFKIPLVISFQCELFHWADVLDIFDEVLDKACKREADTKWILMCDLEGNEQVRQHSLFSTFCF
jgi:hypothetical protein